MSRRSKDRDPKPETEPDDLEIRPLRPSEMESLKGGAQPGPSDVSPIVPVPPKRR
ncbi:MAG TPA: hypothetical protein VGC42_18050 [Kofleriaceae bacterium]